MSAEIQGSCEAQFTPVQDALARNFAEHDEIGCAVTVYHDGKKVVDLWGGHMDTQRTKPWREDTLCIMYSIAKSMCAPLLQKNTSAAGMAMRPCAVLRTRLPASSTV